MYLHARCPAQGAQSLCAAHAACDAEIRSADWSEEVSPFWGEVIKSALTAEGIGGLLKAGWTTIKVQLPHSSHMLACLQPWPPSSCTLPCPMLDAAIRWLDFVLYYFLC